ncbi:alpha-L-iduronidase-like [Uloborus diversus]|uniref:alpha-L-iduronidase-like n=1 Tax=Uloborus diversus TaxID=327109 RepID=UPI0024099315|nr:alpha-L-iduronidase-like [Uloborus diversus]
MLSYFVIFMSVLKFGYSLEVNKEYENECSVAPKLPTNESLTWHHCIKDYNIIVTDHGPVRMLPQFWKSTGLCPPDPHNESFKFLLSADMKQNLFHIGSLPHNGIEIIRIHWMLELVQVQILPKLNAVYNFTFLDELIFALWKNDLHPGFELMGNPSDFFSDFENITQVYAWRDLIHATALRYIALYGIDYVTKWNFETWNEPDHHDFDNLNFTLQGFLNYYDACSEGLRLADKRLRLGGPGGSCHVPSVRHSPLCWALLDHCSHGRNFFTGEKGTRINFISFHKKGNASVNHIVADEMETIQYIRNHFPELKNVPFNNDEADPMKNWALPELWRGDSAYAAKVVENVLNHVEFYYGQRNMNINFSLLSNDNAFLSFFPNQFTERTLLARFQVNNTLPKYVEFVKKPVYVVMGLLSKLCNELMTVIINGKGDGNNFGVISTQCIRNRKEFVIILYNNPDGLHSSTITEVNLSVNISFSGKGFRWTSLEVNNEKTNPYAVWLMLGKPSYPSLQQFFLMKDSENPYQSGPFELAHEPPWKFHIQMTSPSVTLINICQKSKKLKKVSKIHFLQVRNDTLQIAWKDKHNRCLLTYNVEYSHDYSGKYRKINSKKIVTSSFWHACVKYKNCKLKGYYRIYAVNFWYQRGPYSEIAHFKG